MEKSIGVFGRLLLVTSMLALSACAKKDEVAAANSPAATADAAPAADATAAPTDATASASSDSPTLTPPADAPPLPPSKPEPSEPALLAAKSLLLRVVNTGKHLVAVGERGDLVVSNDGEHWAQVQMPVRSMLTSVWFADDQHGWVVGHDAVILATTDGGKTWVIQHFDGDKHQPLLDVLFTDPSHGYAVGAFGSFLATTDGGTTWSEVAADAVRSDTYHINAITRTRAGALVIAGESGLIGVSADGAIWQKQASGYDGSFFGAAPLGEKGAIVFGLRGTTLKSDDVASGQWTKVDLGSTQSAFGAAPLDNGGVVLVGADGLAATVAPDGAVDTKRYSAEGQGGSTYSSAIVWKDGLLITGDLGIGRLKRAP
jgi:photosystem II stability/assembly factor-like uncharacterized protein